jgi:hypothetical protein
LALPERPWQKVVRLFEDGYRGSGDAWQTGETAEGENRWVKEEKPDGHIHPSPLSGR